MTDTLADDIRNAMKETAAVEAEPTPVVEATTEKVADVAPEAEPEEKTAKRGPDGKFVAKEPEVGQDTPAPEEKVAEPAKEAIRVPSSWAPEAKAKFEALDPAVRQAIAKREKEIEYGLQQKDRELKRYAPLEDLIAPRRDQWSLQGMDEVKAIQTLFAAQDLLEKDPVRGLTLLAQSYGVDLASVAGQPHQAQPAAGTTGQLNAQPDPVAAELQALKQELASLKQGREQEVQQTYQSQIEAFAADPANLYFENVKPRMAALLKSGAAADLSDAYQQAIWADPAIRPLLLAQQTAPKAEQTRQHAERARAASVSVTGSPGASPPPTSTGSIADDIRMAIHQVSGRA